MKRLLIVLLVAVCVGMPAAVTLDQAVRDGLALPVDFYTSPQTFLTEELTAAENVASVKTSLVIRGAKEAPGVPFDVLEERLSRSA